MLGVDYYILSDTIFHLFFNFQAALGLVSVST